MKNKDIKDIKNDGDAVRVQIDKVENKSVVSLLFDEPNDGNALQFGRLIYLIRLHEIAESLIGNEIAHRRRQINQTRDIIVQADSAFSHAVERAGIYHQPDDEFNKLVDGLPVLSMPIFLENLYSELLGLLNKRNECRDTLKTLREQAGALDFGLSFGKTYVQALQEIKVPYEPVRIELPEGFRRLQNNEQIEAGDLVFNWKESAFLESPNDVGESVEDFSMVLRKK